MSAYCRELGKCEKAVQTVVQFKIIHIVPPLKICYDGIITEKSEIKHRKNFVEKYGKMNELPDGIN